MEKQNPGPGIIPDPGFYALGRLCCLEVFKQIVDALLVVDLGVFKCVSVGVFNGHIDLAIPGKGGEVDVKGQFVAVKESLRGPIY